MVAKGFKYKLIEGNPRRVAIWKFPDRKSRTPIFFPVLSFYCGGLWESSKFGGGIYREIKEAILADEEIKNMFNFLITSISQFQDFNITRKKREEYYFKKTIKEWFSLNSIIFVDSGGFKLLTSSYKLAKELYTPNNVFYFQWKLGADIIVPLDVPLDTNSDIRERKRRMRISVQNSIKLIEFLENPPTEMKKWVKKVIPFLPIHGHTKEEVESYINMFFKKLDENGFNNLYKGLAIGSLVPHAVNGRKVIEILLEIREVLKKEYPDLFYKGPIHVFGISASLLIPLSFLADSLDSSSYIMSSIHGVIYDEKFRRTKVGKWGWKKIYRKSSIGKKYKIPTRGTIALHNLEILMKELVFLKNKMFENSVDEIKKRYEDRPLIRKFLEMVIPS